METTEPGITAGINANVPATTTLDEPALGVLERRTVTLKLAIADNEANCHFWIGLAKPGELTPASLLDQKNVSAVFAEAASKGVSDEGPIMLSDTSVNPTRFIYLLQVPGPDFRDRTAWVTSLVNMIRSWAPRTAGFYMAPELILANDSQELLQQVLRELILTTPATDFYLLVGTHGLNAVLNTSLRLKLELESDTLNLLVFH